MIIFGWGQGAKELGEGFWQTCDHCGNTSRFVVAEMSRKVTLYFVPVAKWNRKYFYVCPICSYGFEVPNRELAQRILAAAFRDPVTPDSRLVALLNKAMGASIDKPGQEISCSKRALGPITAEEEQRATGSREREAQRKRDEDAKREAEEQTTLTEERRGREKEERGRLEAERERERLAAEQQELQRQRENQERINAERRRREEEKRRQRQEATERERAATTPQESLSIATVERDSRDRTVVVVCTTLLLGCAAVIVGFTIAGRERYEVRPEQSASNTTATMPADTEILGVHETRKLLGKVNSEDEARRIIVRVCDAFRESDYPAVVELSRELESHAPATAQLFVGWVFLEHGDDRLANEAFLQAYPTHPCTANASLAALEMARASQGMAPYAGNPIAYLEAAKSADAEQPVVYLLMGQWKEYLFKSGASATYATSDYEEVHRLRPELSEAELLELKTIPYRQVWRLFDKLR